MTDYLQDFTNEQLGAALRVTMTHDSQGFGNLAPEHLGAWADGMEQKQGYVTNTSHFLRQLSNSIQMRRKSSALKRDKEI